MLPLAATFTGGVQFVHLTDVLHPDVAGCSCEMYLPLDWQSPHWTGKWRANGPWYYSLIHSPHYHMVPGEGGRPEAGGTVQRGDHVVRGAALRCGVGGRAAVGLRRP